MSAEQPIRIGVHTEPSTKRAAALLTVGIPFAEECDGLKASNVYTEKKPYRPGMPGEVSYLLALSKEGGPTAMECVEAYDAKDFGPAIQLDELVDEIEKANPLLGQRLRKLLPLAIVSYLRGGFENRERILDLWKKAMPMVLIRKGANSFALVHRKASAELRARFGVN